MKCECHVRYFWNKWQTRPVLQIFNSSTDYRYRYLFLKSSIDECNYSISLLIYLVFSLSRMTNTHCVIGGRAQCWGRAKLVPSTVGPQTYRVTVFTFSNINDGVAYFCDTPTIFADIFELMLQFLSGFCR